MYIAYNTYDDGITIDSVKYNGRFEFMGFRVEMLGYAIFAVAHLVSTDNGSVYPWISDGSIFINSYRSGLDWQSIGFHRIH